MNCAVRHLVKKIALNYINLTEFFHDRQKTFFFLDEIFFSQNFNFVRVFIETSD